MDVTRAILPHFRANKSGILINVSSGAGMFTVPLMALYSASKFALEGFSEGIYYELAAVGVTQKLVIPHDGLVQTNFGQSAQALAPSMEGKDFSDYNEFLAKAGGAMVDMHSVVSLTPAEVADVIFEAATDGKDKLRYLVGGDSYGFVKARRTLTEDAYMNFMRSKFVRWGPVLPTV